MRILCLVQLSTTLMDQIDYIGMSIVLFIVNSILVIFKNNSGETSLTMTSKAYFKVQCDGPDEQE